MTTWIGIDPGLTGGVAILPADGGVPQLFDTPTTLTKGKRGYLPAAMAALVQDALFASSDVFGKGTLEAVLEAQQPFPRQGTVSTGSIMRGYGLWEGILAALGVPYTRVRPVEWKAAMRAGRGGDKELARRRALELFPQAAPQLARKADHGRAEALLLASFGARGFTKATDR